MKRVTAGGGFPAIWYTLRKSRQAGGYLRMWKALRSKNACKTCALGMGGQKGGMVNEAGAFPEVCKKSIQAMAADMQGAIQPEFFQKFDFKKLRSFSPREMETAGRITQPYYAGPEDKSYRPISWEEAIARTAQKLKNTAPDDSFWYFSGRSSNEAGFLLQLFARLYGTNNVNNCSFYCHQASGVGLTSVTGSGTATVVLEDCEHADLLFVIGANPASNHPRFMRTILNMKRQGGKVVVVNPLKELGLVRFKVPSDVRSLLFGTKIADEYIQPHIGGDIAFLSGIAKSILEKNQIDRAFLEAHTEPWPRFEAHIQGLAWEEITAKSGVDKATIEKIAGLYAASKKTIFCWAMGVTHHEFGVQTVQLIGALAAMRGMLGRPQAGLLPLRGHSNVQGIGSMGVTPQLKDIVLKKLEAEFQVKLPTSKGMDTLACMEKADAGKVRFAFCLGGNLYGSNPDSAFAERAMRQIDFVVYLSTTLNTGHAVGRGKETLILPVLARDEEPQPTTQESMFNYVRVSDGGKTRHEGLKSEVEVIASIAEQVLGTGTVPSPVDWNSMRQHGRIRDAISKIIPGYEQLAEVDATKKEFHIPGRTFHQPEFATASGRAQLHIVPLPALKVGSPETAARELRLMTVRSEGQFNTVVYEEEDLYRGQDRRDVILMNAADIRRMGLNIDQPVTVRSNTGMMPGIRVRAFDVRAGNAVMYYPEANALVPKTADPASKTPAFKSILVTIQAGLAGPTPV